MFSDEIKSSTIIGYLHDKAVNLIRTIGGLYIALVKNKENDEILTSASHPAIIRYQLLKNKNFKPILAKNASHIDNVVADNYSVLLPQKIFDRGYDLYGIPNNNYYSYFLTLCNLTKCELAIETNLNETKFLYLKAHQASEKEKEILKNALKLIYKINEENK